MSPYDNGSVFIDLGAVTNGEASVTIDQLGRNGQPAGSLIDGETYTLRLYQLKQGKSYDGSKTYSGQQPDQNDFAEIQNGDVLGGSYALSLPDQDLTVSPGIVELHAIKTDYSMKNGMKYYTANDTNTSVNPQTILNAGIEYGILAEMFQQGNDLQSNFATNFGKSFPVMTFITFNYNHIFSDQNI